MTTIQRPRKSREVVAAEKAARHEMYVEIKAAIRDNKTRADPHDMFLASSNKYTQMTLLSSIDADRNMKRRTARLQTLKNSIGSGYSMEHVLWVCTGLESVGCNYEAAVDRITAESLKSHRYLYSRVSRTGEVSRAATFAAWALNGGPEFIERVHQIALERDIFDQPTVEEIMSGSESPSLADGVL